MDAFIFAISRGFIYGLFTFIVLFVIIFAISAVRRWATIRQDELEREEAWREKHRYIKENHEV